VRFACNFDRKAVEADLFTTLRKIFLWRYARNTWQWDILCVLILVFIFLTPKTWFEGSERQTKKAHQTPTTATLLVDSEVVDNAADSTKLKQRIQTLTGRYDAEIVEVRKVLDQEGKTVGYQVDIR
jgi:hypothetical protein